MKKRLTLLIFTACAVFVGSVGLVFWALAATQVNVTSGLLVTYTPGLHVVCDVNATYQRTNDSSAIAFSQGNLSLKYNGTITDTTLEATSSALQLDDSNTYVVFEFTFQNKNLEKNYDLTITLTDNGIVTNMTRKYYFGDLSSSNISAKRTTIKNSGIDNSLTIFQKTSPRLPRNRQNIYAPRNHPRHNSQLSSRQHQQVCIYHDHRRACGSGGSELSASRLG